MIQWVEARGPVLYPDALAGASPCGENLIAVVVFDGERQRVGRLGRSGAQQPSRLPRVPGVGSGDLAA